MDTRIRKPGANNIFIAFIFIVGVIICSVIIPDKNRNTFIFYMTMLSVSIFLSLLSELSYSRKMASVFLVLSMAVLGFVMAFRAQTGIDDPAYREIFYNAGYKNLIRYLLSSNMEYGYLVLNYILYYITGANYDLVQVILIYIPFIFCGIAINKLKDFCDSSVLTLIIWTHYYPIIMGAGLIRMFIAVSMIFLAISFLFENNTKKFVIITICASFIHISSLIILILLITKIDRKWFERNWILAVAIMCVILAIGVFFLLRIIYSIGFTSKYFHYIQSGFNISIGDFDVLPVILIGIYMQRYINSENKGKYILGLIIASLSVLFSIMSHIIDIGRTIFYSNLGVAIICSAIAKLEIKKLYDYLFLAILIAYSLLYMMHTGYLGNLHENNLFPYRSLLGFTI